MEAHSASGGNNTGKDWDCIPELWLSISKLDLVFQCCNLESQINDLVSQNNDL